MGEMRNSGPTRISWRPRLKKLKHQQKCQVEFDSKHTVMEMCCTQVNILRLIRVIHRLNILSVPRMQNIPGFEFWIRDAQWIKSVVIPI